MMDETVSQLSIFGKASRVTTMVHCDNADTSGDGLLYGVLSPLSTG